jgi:hypothetical protein
MIFDSDKISEIHRQAVHAGLHANEKRSLLFFGVTVEYVASLRTMGDPSNQLLSDLQSMSNDEWVNNSIPLVIWLRNAANQTKVFQDRTEYFSQCADNAAKTPRPRTFLGIPKSRHVNTGPVPAPPSPSLLDAARKEGLVKAIEACLTIEDLQVALQRCFGDLPNLYGGSNRAAPAVRDLALQSIDLVEREKLTVVFLHFVGASARCSKQLWLEATSIFPELQIVDQSFAAIVDSAAKYLGENAVPIATLLGNKQFANQLDLSVKELKCFKRLHEATHQVKNNPPPRLPDDADATNENEFRQELRAYLSLLNTARARLQEALDELPANSAVRAAQQPGVTLLGGFARRIDAALKRADFGAVEAALDDTARMVDPMLDDFNQHIVEMARGLLDGPLNALRSILAATTANAANAVDALRLALLLRVVEHTRWQEIDNSLFSLGGTFRSDTTSAFKKFARRWGVARKQIPVLSDFDSKIDTARLQALARNVDSALYQLDKSVSATAGGGNKDVFNSIMLEPFDEFRYETQQQFLLIDSAFKRDCAELVRVAPGA